MTGDTITHNRADGIERSFAVDRTIQRIER